MAQEKDKLLKYLCMALPYGVKADSRDGKKIITITPIGIANFMSGAIDVIKPYLRPMSSMTEEERLMYEGLMIGTDNVPYMLDVIDWFLAHHFDFMGLIDEGPAIEVTEDNNPYK